MRNFSISLALWYSYLYFTNTGTIPILLHFLSPTVPATSTLLCWKLRRELYQHFQQHRIKSIELLQGLKLCMSLTGRWKPNGTSTATPRYPEQNHSAGAMHPWAARPRHRFCLNPALSSGKKAECLPPVQGRISFSYRVWGWLAARPPLSKTFMLQRTTKSFPLSVSGLAVSPSNPHVGDLFHHFNFTMRDKRNKD